MGLCLIVHQGGVPLEEPVILPADGLLEQMDGLWIIEVVLPTGSGLVLPQALQCQVSLLSQGVEGAVVVPLHCGGHLLQADAPHP